MPVVVRAGRGSGSGPCCRSHVCWWSSADLAVVLDAVEPNAPAVMVGSSLGGPVLHVFVQAHPERVTGLVLVDVAVGEVLQQRQIRVMAREARESLSQVPTLGQILAGLPEVPVVALVGERADRGEAKARAAVVDLFRREMQSHPLGRFVAASRSGHFVPCQ
jgi:pimeloyl-ACP methyl ester carboxylesterase